MSEQPVERGLAERLLTLEERKLTLEEKEQTSKGRDRRGEFWKTNLAALLAFFTSIASLFIAYRSVQVTESSERRRGDAERQRFNLDTQKAIIDANEYERKWHMELLDFTAKNRELIFGSDDVAKERISQIMLVTFPSDLVLPLFKRLEKVSPRSDAWKQGAAQAQKLSQSQTFERGTGGMILGGFTAKPGTVVVLHTGRGSAGLVTYAVVVRRFTGEMVAAWTPVQLETKGGTFITEADTSYNITVLPVTKSSATLHATLELSGDIASTEEVAIKDNRPFGWRIFAD